MVKNSYLGANMVQRLLEFVIVKRLTNNKFFSTVGRVLNFVRLNDNLYINSNNAINLKTDYQLLETANIMNDFLNLNKKTILSSIE